MRTLLHVSASPRASPSHSRRYGRDVISALQATEPWRVVKRDLGARPLPYPDVGFVTASLMAEPERGAAEVEALSLSERLIAELEAADAVVIDTPMHNFAVPAVLKAWIDYTLRPSRTFLPGRQGKVGLLRDRAVYVIVACGGGFEDAGGRQTDFLTPYLRYALGTIGLLDVKMIRLDNLLRGDGAIACASALAAVWIESQVKRQA